ALRNGRSVDTTMGFTPLDGLVMGTRSGAIDPGLVTYLMRARRLNIDAMEDLLYRGSGLLAHLAGSPRRRPSRQRRSSRTVGDRSFCVPHCARNWRVD